MIGWFEVKHDVSPPPPQVQAILEAWLHPTNPSNLSSPRPHSTSPLSGWVAPEEEKASREEHSSQFKPSCTPLFQLPLDPKLWVIPKIPSSPVVAAGAHPSPAAEEDKWLLKKRSQAQVFYFILFYSALTCWHFDVSLLDVLQELLALPTVCDLFSCMKVGGDKEKWLHKAPVQVSVLRFSFTGTLPLMWTCYHSESLVWGQLPPSVYTQWWFVDKFENVLSQRFFPSRCEASGCLSLSATLYCWSAHTTIVWSVPSSCDLTCSSQDQHGCHRKTFSVICNVSV